MADLLLRQTGVPLMTFDDRLAYITQEALKTRSEQSAAPLARAARVDDNVPAPPVVPRKAPARTQGGSFDQMTPAEKRATFEEQLAAAKVRYCQPPTA